MLRNVRSIAYVFFAFLCIVGLLASARAHIQDGVAVWTVSNGGFDVTVWTNLINPANGSTIGAGQSFLLTSTGGINVIATGDNTEDVDIGYQLSQTCTGNGDSYSNSSQVFTETFPAGWSGTRTPNSALYHSMTLDAGIGYASATTTAHPLSTEDWQSALDAHSFTVVD